MLMELAYRLVVDESEHVRAGDLAVRVGIYRRDEIGTLVESFNDLIAILVERDSLQARLEAHHHHSNLHDILLSRYGDGAGHDNQRPGVAVDVALRGILEDANLRDEGLVGGRL